MKVSFNSTQPVKLAPLKPVEEQTVPQAVASEQKRGAFDTTREVWKTTLKTTETVKAYSLGLFKGIKNAIYAGAALVGIDWLITSSVHIGQEKNTVGHMLGTPFVLAGKSIRNVSKTLCSLAQKDGITLGQFVKKTVWDAPKKVLKTINKSKNVSKVGKWGIPVIALIIGGYTAFRSCLDANERAARIDHRYGGEVGHHKA